LGPNATKERAGVVLDHPNSPRVTKDTQPHYIYKPESCLENDNYKLYFDRTVLTDIHIQHNRPDIIILNKQQKQAYLLDIAVPNSHNITQTYNTKINKYL
jgi:hypothetical protein